MYMHCKNQKQPFVEKVDGDFTAWYYDFSKFVEHILNETREREMKQMHKDIEKKSKSSNSPAKGRKSR